MHQASLASNLADLPLPGIRYYDTIDSTNDEAWRWVADQAPHLALVVADEQTAGKGRLNRRWVTRHGTGLAFSLVLRPPAITAMRLPHLTGLGALAACQALQNDYALKAQIKWPNDILLHQRKAGGVLVETRWQGENLLAAVVGIGINIAPGSLNPIALPPGMLNFPATCVEDILGHPIDGMELLHSVLKEFVSLLAELASPRFIQAWEKHLAFHDQWVELIEGTTQLSPENGKPRPGATIGKVAGLAQNGALILQTRDGKSVIVEAGELRLRPILTPADG